MWRHSEVLVTLIRVQYDAYNRLFRLLDARLARVLEDGEVYLITDLSTSDFEPAETVEAFEMSLPHA